ncbi:MAG TPA: hypothetical protein VHP13_09860, partial [Gammaproteobacteria bacterium]|nr:hypothetical protein [Gammaproteobacteria bacterium]
DGTFGGDLTSTNGALAFGDGVAIKKNLVMTADTIGFNGGGHSVTTSNGSTLSLVPQTAGTHIVIGSGGANALSLNGTALSGYQGSMFIGAVPTDPTQPTAGVTTPIPAGDIDVNGDITLTGTGSVLVITSTGTLNLNGTLTAPTMIIGGTVGVFNPNSTGVLISNDIQIVGGTIGQEGNDITGSAYPGAVGTLNFGTSSSAAQFDMSGITVQQDPGTVVSLYALELGVDVNQNAHSANSGQQAAANQQTGGLLGSGFIDVSVFQQISLYDVNGSGIQLPGDQCEEESTTGAGCGQ